jgi:hypothetical protein
MMAAQIFERAVGLILLQLVDHISAFALFIDSPSTFTFGQ